MHPQLFLGGALTGFSLRKGFACLLNDRSLSGADLDIIRQKHVKHVSSEGLGGRNASGFRVGQHGLSVGVNMLELIPVLADVAKRVGGRMTVEDLLDRLLAEGDRGGS